MTNKLFKAFLAMSSIYAVFIFYLSSKTELPKVILMVPGLAYLIIGFLEQIGLTMLFYPAYYAYHHLDKLEHIVLYFGFGILLYFTFYYSRNTAARRYAAPFAIMIGITYGVLDEVHQYFVPGRTASMSDMLADGIGLVLAQVFILLLLILIKRIKHKKASRT